MANRVAFYVNEAMQHNGVFEIDRVVENEPGYWVAGLYGSIEVARETCRIRNTSNGLTHEDVMKIVASSMAAGRIEK